MLTILSVYLCLHGVCREVVVPTPVDYECGGMLVEELDAYLTAHFPRWNYKGFKCSEGRVA